MQARKIFEVFRPAIEPIAESCACTTFRHGLPTILDHRRLVDSRPGSCRPISHVTQAYKPRTVSQRPRMRSHGTVWLYCSWHRMALLENKQFMAYWCLEILTGPARVVTIDYCQFAYGCSQARKASATARTVHVCRIDVRILTIPRSTDNP